jgi:hypothetical protein
MVPTAISSVLATLMMRPTRPASCTIMSTSV